MHTSDMPHGRCLACGHSFDAASCMTDDAQPKPGDISICIECGYIMMFGTNLRVRELTASEMIEIAGNREIVRIQTARAAVMADKKS